MRLTKTIFTTMNALQRHRVIQHGPGPSLVSPYNIGSHRLRLARPIYSGQEQQQKKEQQQQEQPQSPPPRMNRNFISNFVDNIKEEMRRNKELQENKKQLEERLKQLNDSEVRQKFDKIQRESAESTELIKHRLNEFSDYVNSLVVDLKQSKVGQEALQQLKTAVDTAERVAKQVGETQVYKQVAYVAQEIDKIADVRMYTRPEELKMRTDIHSHAFAQRHVEANMDATDVELHKESRWYSGWKSFSESNPYLNKILDWKTRMDESEHILARAVRTTMEKIQVKFSSSDSTSNVLTEIAKVDPAFNVHEWLRFCEKEIIPNILEAGIQMNLDVLQDWCYERAFNMIATGLKEYQKIGFHTKDSHIIDVSKVEMINGKMIPDLGPALAITFQVFMLHVVKNSEGKVVEGDPANPIRVNHYWVLCRDMEQYNPATAWKLLELHVQKGQLVI